MMKYDDVAPFCGDVTVLLVLAGTTKPHYKVKRLMALSAYLEGWFAA